MEFFEIDKYIVPILDITPTQDRRGIESTRYLGTGFFISPGILMTCQHVIAGAKNFACVPVKLGTMTQSVSNEIFNMLVDIKTHPYADLALARIGKEAIGSYSHLQVDMSSNIFLGKDVFNYSYVGYNYEFSRVWLTPRYFKGYITRTSVEQRDSRRAYIEVNFPAMLGMSGSPILDDSGQVIGVVYRNFRSQILEDYVEEYHLMDGETKLTEAHTTYKVVDFAQAVDLSKYHDFIIPELG